jgi:hypothetical protein
MRRLTPSEVLTALLLASAGCAGSRVSRAELVAMPLAPTGQCKELGRLVGRAENSESVGDLPLQATRDLKRQAEARGATHLQLLAAPAGASEAEAHGAAFLCEGDVSYPDGSVFGPRDPRAGRSNAWHAELAPQGPPVARRPPTAALGKHQEQPGCLRGHVYQIGSEAVLPDAYGETDPAAELWSCDWNIATPAGARTS